MKTNLLSILTFFSLLFFIGCNKDSVTNEEEALTKSEILNERKIDQTIDFAGNLVDDEFDFGASARTNSNGGFPNCATVTSVKEGNNWIKTIDFGVEGCQFGDKTIKGKIIMSYTTDDATSTKIVSITYENFYLNGTNINGTSKNTRTKSNTNGNPESKFEFDLTTTLENGDVYSRKGFKMREWTEGSDTPTKEDDVYIFTGNWTTVSPTRTISTNITKPLKKTGTCNYFVEGTIEYTKGDDVAILDFGNGECDNKATLSINGGTPEEIDL